MFDIAGVVRSDLYDSDDGIWVGVDIVKNHAVEGRFVYVYVVDDLVLKLGTEDTVTFPREVRKFFLLETETYCGVLRGVAVLNFILELVQGGEVMGLERFSAGSSVDPGLALTLTSQFVANAADGTANITITIFAAEKVVFPQVVGSVFAFRAASGVDVGLANALPRDCVAHS